MKKLMIAAAIVCAAAFANAGSVIWGFTSDAIVAPTAAYDDGFGYIDGSLVSCILSVWNGASYEQLTTAGQNPDYTFGDTDDAQPFVSASIRDVTGLMSQTDKFLVQLTTTDGKYTLSFEGDALVREIVGIGFSTFMQEMTHDSLGTDPGDWKSTVIPEPTSGLLMLIGMGALALRRRRA